MITLATVVEGHGEVQAVPVLLRRLSAQLRPELSPVIPTPFRLPRGKFTVSGELERAVSVAARRVTGGGGVLVLADADDDCPVDLAARLVERLRARAVGCRCAVVLADREFEAWFLAGMSSLASHPDVLPSVVAHPFPESVRDAKGQVAAQLRTGKYSETRHQPAFAQRLDLDAASSCRSFRKLRTEIAGLLAD